MASEQPAGRSRTMSQEDIERKGSQLKKTATKELDGAASAEDVAKIAKLYPADGKDLEKVAEQFGLDASLLKAKPPKDAEDFAKRVLEGAYSHDATDVAKREFRAKLLGSIMERRPSLKQTPSMPQRNRMVSNVTEDELHNFGSFFVVREGDLEAIAKESGLPVDLLKNNPPKDAADFVQKLMEGEYTFDMDEQAKLLFRAALRKEMKAHLSKLKRVTTKEWDGQANEADVAMFGKIYTQNKGDLGKLAELFSLSLEAMQLNPPADDREFAKKVLLGTYTPDTIAKIIDDFRQDFSAALRTHGHASLKHTETKQSNNTPEPGQVAKVAKIYNDLKGDLAQCAIAVGADFAEISKNQPKDANDFAVKVLAGAYSTESFERFRRSLSQVLHKDISEHTGLKQTSTLEKVGEPQEEDIVRYATVFTENEGNLLRVVSVLGCDAELLQKDAPTDARQFASKYLKGFYQR